MKTNLASLDQHAAFKQIRTLYACMSASNNLLHVVAPLIFIKDEHEHFKTRELKDKYNKIQNTLYAMV